jgi:hypothetical protein
MRPTAEVAPSRQGTNANESRADEGPATTLNHPLAVKTIQGFFAMDNQGGHRGGQLQGDVPWVAWSRFA